MLFVFVQFGLVCEFSCLNKAMETHRELQSGVDVGVEVGVEKWYHVTVGCRLSGSDTLGDDSVSA